MCKAKPGARCANHAQESIQKHRARVEQLATSGAPADLAKLPAVVTELERAEWDYAATDTGRQHWIEQRDAAGPDSDEYRRAQRMIELGGWMRKTRRLHVDRMPSPAQQEKYPKDAAEVARLRNQLAYEQTALRGFELDRSPSGPRGAREEKLQQATDRTAAKLNQIAARHEWEGSAGRCGHCPSCGTFDHGDCGGLNTRMGTKSAALSTTVTEWNSDMAAAERGDQQAAARHREAIELAHQHGHAQCGSCGQFRRVDGENHQCRGQRVQAFDANASGPWEAENVNGPSVSAWVEQQARIHGYMPRGQETPMGEYRLCPDCGQFGHRRCYGMTDAIDRSTPAQRGASTVGWNEDMAAMRNGDRAAAERHQQAIDYMRESGHLQCPDCGQFVPAAAPGSHVCPPMRVMEADDQTAWVDREGHIRPGRREDSATEPVAVTVAEKETQARAEERADELPGWGALGSRAEQRSELDALFTGKAATIDAPAEKGLRVDSSDPTRPFLTDGQQVVHITTGESLKREAAETRDSDEYRAERARLAPVEPVDFDREYVKLLDERARPAAQYSEAKRTMDRAMKRLGVTGIYWDDKLASAVEKGQEEEFIRQTKAVEEAYEPVRAVDRKLLPYEDEYTSRPWNRVMLSNSADGHIHRDRYCSSLNRNGKMSSVSWLVDYSGASDEKIVADAGWRACTHCYPDAPLGDKTKLPTKMFSEDEQRRMKERERQAADRAVRQKKAAAAAIYAPGSGEPLRDEYNRVINTERTAITNGKNALHYARTSMNPDFVRKQGAEARRMAEAVAAKNGRSTDEVWAEWNAKADKECMAHAAELQASLDRGEVIAEDPETNARYLADYRQQVDRLVEDIATNSGRASDDVRSELAKKVARLLKKTSK